MASTELRELLRHELGDLYFAEKHFLKGLRRMVKEIDHPKLQARVEKHVGETERHVERLEQAFAAIGEKPKAEKCESAIGLVEEHDSFKAEEKPSRRMLEAFDLGSGLRVEHYEIAGYRSAVALAKTLGEKECAKLLRENLSEEEDMARFLEKNAPRALKAMAKQIAKEEKTRAKEEARREKEKARTKAAKKKGTRARSRKEPATSGA